MTKIGEGKELPEQPGVQQYHTQLRQSTTKFLNALESYDVTSDAAQKAQLKSIMDQQLGLIRSAVNEIKRAGVHKQEVKVESDYTAYMEHRTPETFAALEHDVVTLQEYNELSE